MERICVAPPSSVEAYLPLRVQFSVFIHFYALPLQMHDLEQEALTQLG